jgi:hypothetical protein
MKKGKRDQRSPPFVRLAKELLFKHHEWWSLRPGARDIYLLLKAKYNGSNNGSIRLYYSEIRERKICGLRSSKAISSAFRELERAGWIERTRLGGLYRHLNDYRLTGKHDNLL